MSIKDFIPSIFSASVLRGYEKASIFANVISRDYSGEISNVGDRVRVPKIGPVEIRDYEKGTPIDYNEIDGSFLDVVVDKAKYWGLRAEDVDQLQSAPAFLDGATKNASYALRDEIDKYSAEILTTGAGTKLYEKNPYDSDHISLFTELAMVLDEQNVPRGSRFVIIPPSVLRRLTLSIISAGTPNEKPLSEGYIAKIAGFDTYLSNNLVKTPTGVKVIAGVRESATHILQLAKTEALRDKDSFSDLVRGLAVYTTAVLLPAGLVTAHVKRAIEEPDEIT